MLSKLQIKKEKPPKTPNSQDTLYWNFWKLLKTKEWKVLKAMKRYGTLAIRKKTIQNSHHKPLSQRKWHNWKPGHYIWNKHMNSLKGGEKDADGLESSWSIKWYSHFVKHLEVPLKTKHTLMYSPTITFLGIYPRKLWLGLYL